MAGSIARRPNGKWRARYRDETGHEHTRHFDRKVDAQQWLDQVTATVVTGTYADPKAGQITFAAFYGEWSARQVWAPGTVLAMSLAARSVPFGDKPMRQVRRSDVEVWIKSMDAAGLAPGTIKTRYVNVRSVFRAAVRDRVIGTDPTDTVRLPGISNANPDQIRTAQDVLAGRLASVQNQYSPAYRSSEPELRLCQELGIAFLPWSPLGGSSRAAELGSIFAAFQEIADAHGVSPQQVTLAWMLAAAPVVIPIPGSSRPETVLDSARSVELDLSADELERLSQIS